MSDANELLIRGTAWLALLAWAMGEVLLALPAGARFARLVWTLGAVALAGHLLLAMHWKHGWSHAAAVADTARQTAARLGVDWGGGVWLNYLTAAWWLADAAWSWCALSNWAGVSRWRTARRAWFLFMWFNSVVVFPTGAVRWAGLGICLVVVAAWWRRTVRGSDRA